MRSKYNIFEILSREEMYKNPFKFNIKLNKIRQFELSKLLRINV